MRRLWIYAAVAFALDQASKYAVLYLLDLRNVLRVEVLPPLLNFRYGENYGINFGVGGSDVNKWVWIGIAMVICAGVIWWLRSVKNMPNLGYVCAGLLIGGALGNVVDRFVHGYVVDFLNNSCCGLNNPFSYNVADIFVFAGAIGLVFVTPDPKKGAKKDT